MPVYSIISIDYKDVFSKCFIKRLEEKGFCPKLNDGRVETCLNNDSSGLFSTVLAETLTIDLRPFEMARLAAVLPLSKNEITALLPRALKISNERDHVSYAAGAAQEHFKTESSMCAEGFLRFRLPSVMESWAMAAETAGEELLLGRERAELMELCGVLYELHAKDRRRGMCLILYNDGSCAVTDESGCRIECASCDPEILLPLLVSLAPERLAVYDLTGGGKGDLLGGISRMFGSKACFFIKNGE